MKIKAENVHYMPRTLAPGILYFSPEFKTAAHLCACGCGAKVRTPLTPTEWRLTLSKKGPTLHPSIGNWQLPCKSHYIIKEGNIVWAKEWSSAQIEYGRKQENLRRNQFYSNKKPVNKSLLSSLWAWLTKLFQ